MIVTAIAAALTVTRSNSSTQMTLPIKARSRRGGFSIVHRTACAYDAMLAPAKPNEVVMTGRKQTSDIAGTRGQPEATEHQPDNVQD